MSRYHNGCKSCKWRKNCSDKAFGGNKRGIDYCKARKCRKPDKIAEGLALTRKQAEGLLTKLTVEETAKVGDIIKFNPATAYDNSESELTSLLKVAKEDALNHKGDFNFQISEITRFVAGPLNEELFEAIYPGAEIKTEEEFRTKIKGGIEEQFKKDSDYKFILDARKYVTEKVGKLEFPDEKLRKIMLANAKGDQKKVDENYDKSIQELTWHLIKEQLVEQAGVKVDDTDVREMAKEVTRMQFAQYGMLNIPEEYLENSVKEMLKKRETVDNLIDRCVEVKLGASLKEQVTLEEKTVTTEEFNKLFD